MSIEDDLLDQTERVLGVLPQPDERDHEDPESALVVWENEQWAIVEAMGRESLMAARRSDPRALGAVRTNPTP